MYTSVAGNNRVEPVVANGNINTANGARTPTTRSARQGDRSRQPRDAARHPAEFIGAGTASAITTIDPELGRAIDQTVTSDAKVENLAITLATGRGHHARREGSDLDGDREVRQRIDEAAVQR